MPARKDGLIETLYAREGAAGQYCTACKASRGETVEGTHTILRQRRRPDTGELAGGTITHACAHHFETWKRRHGAKREHPLTPLEGYQEHAV